MDGFEHILSFGGRERVRPCLNIYKVRVINISRHDHEREYLIVFFPVLAFQANSPVFIEEFRVLELIQRAEHCPIVHLMPIDDKVAVLPRITYFIEEKGAGDTMFSVDIRTEVGVVCFSLHYRPGSGRAIYSKPSLIIRVDRKHSIGPVSLIGFLCSRSDSLQG